MRRRWEEDEFQKISDYLEGLRFKKSLYGVSLEDVYSRMKELDRMYREMLEDYKDSLNEEVEERRRGLEDREAKIEQMMQKVTNIQKGRKEDQETIKELQEQLAQEERRQMEYKEKTTLLAETLTDTQKNKAFVIEQANREARAILYDAEREAGKLLEQSKHNAIEEEEKSKMVLEEISRLRNKAADSLKLIQVDLSSLSENVVNLQDKIENVPDHIETIKVEIGHTKNTDVGDIKRFERYEATKR